MEWIECTTTEEGIGDPGENGRATLTGTLTGSPDGCLLIHIGMVVFILCSATSLSGCQRAPQAPGGTARETRPPAPTVGTMQEHYDLVVDEETGCQYWRNKRSNGATTPRWAWGGSGTHVKGCR